MAERTLTVAGHHLRLRVSSVPREAAESFAAFAETLRAVPREPAGPPPAPPSEPAPREVTPLPHGLVQRPLTDEDLGRMIARELPPRSGDPDPTIRVVTGKGQPYFVDIEDGYVSGHCIAAEAAYGARNDLVAVLAVKHLLDFDEAGFRSVANSSTTTRLLRRLQPR